MPCVWTKQPNHNQNMTEIGHFKVCSDLHIFQVLPGVPRAPWIPKIPPTPCFFYHENYFTPGPCMWTTLLNHKQKLTEIGHFKVCTTWRKFPVLLISKARARRVPLLSCVNALASVCFFSAVAVVLLFCAVVLLCCCSLFRCSVVRLFHFVLLYCNTATSIFNTQPKFPRCAVTRNHEKPREIEIDRCSR